MSYAQKDGKPSFCAYVSDIFLLFSYPQFHLQTLDKIDISVIIYIEVFLSTFVY